MNYYFKDLMLWMGVIMFSNMSGRLSSVDGFEIYGWSLFFASMICLHFYGEHQKEVKK